MKNLELYKKYKKYSFEQLYELLVEISENEEKIVDKDETIKEVLNLKSVKNNEHFFKSIFDPNDLMKFANSVSIGDYHSYDPWVRLDNGYRVLSQSDGAYQYEIGSKRVEIVETYKSLYNKHIVSKYPKIALEVL